MDEQIIDRKIGGIVIDAMQQDLLASTGQRLGNMFLDTVFLYVFSFVIGVFLLLFGLGSIIDHVNDYFLGIILLIIYYLPQEAYSGRTLGKLITGTKAVNEDGTQLTFGKALGRTLCRFLPFEVFTFLGQEGRPKGLHDHLPKTKVITMKRK